MKRASTIAAERDALARRLADMTHSRDALWAQRDELWRECELLRADLLACQVARNAYSAACGRVIMERDAFLREREQAREHEAVAVLDLAIARLTCQRLMQERAVVLKPGESVTFKVFA